MTKLHTFNPGDLVQVRGMPPERIYSYSSKIELHGQENYLVLSVIGKLSGPRAAVCLRKTCLLSEK